MLWILRAACGNAPTRWIKRARLAAFLPSVGSSVALTDLLRSLTSQLICNGAQWTSTPIHMEMDHGTIWGYTIHVGGPIHWIWRSNRRIRFSFGGTNGRGELCGFLQGVHNVSSFSFNKYRNSFSHRFRARLRYKWHGIGAWDSAETQAASLPHHLHRRAARGTRASLFPHPIPGRLHPGRAGSDHGPHRSPYPGMVLQPQGTPSQALWRLKLRAFAHEQWKL